MNLNIFSRRWEKVYTEAKAFDFSDVQDDRPLYDFLKSIKGIDPMFARICPAEKP